VASEGTTRGRDAAGVIPGRYSPRFAKFFGVYLERLFASRMHAVRVARRDDGVPTSAALHELDEHAGPVMVLLSHSAWWDPLVGLLLARRYVPSRSGCAPMEADQLRTFGFFRRLGLFGIDPEDPRSLSQMLAYVQGCFAREARPTLWLTPQGTFADPRAPLVLRPGAAAVAARTPGVRVVAVTMEYGFWLDQRPEVFIRVERVDAPLDAPLGRGRPSTGRWHRAMQQAMRDSAARLADAVMSRDPARFEVIAGRGVKGGSRVNPIYDLWQRLRGKRAAIASTRVRGSLDDTQGGTSPQRTELRA
jgi:1-acyl-sn-glycerol-3-phosphate acyltransferase